MTLGGTPQMLMNRAVRELGPDRLLLGSWHPEHDSDFVIAQIQRAWGHEGAPEDRFAANAERALKGEGAGT